MPQVSVFSMRILVPFLLPFLLGAIFVASPLPAAPAVETRDGVEHVLNPAPPAGGVEILTPRRIYEIGGDSEADEEMFGIVLVAMADEEGNAYFLDAMLNEVRMFSPEGEFVRSLGRRGEGPGEFYNAMSAFLTPDGRVAISQIMPTSVVTVDIATGDAGPNIPLPLDGMIFPRDMAPLGAGYVLSYVNAVHRDGESVNDRVLAVVDARGSGEIVLCRDTLTLREGRRTTATDRRPDYINGWCVTAGGLICVAPDYLEYRIDCYAADGRKARVIEREYETLPRTEAELREIQENYRRLGYDAPARELDPLHKAVVRLVARSNGELWALTTRGLKSATAGSLGVFDVFDSAGRLTRRVEVPCDYNPDFDKVFIERNRLFVLKEGRNAPPRTSSSGGMTFVRSGEPTPEDTREEVPPFSIVCYELPD